MTPAGGIPAPTALTALAAFAPLALLVAVGVGVWMLIPPAAARAAGRLRTSGQPAGTSGSGPGRRLPWLLAGGPLIGVGLDGVRGLTLGVVAALVLGTTGVLLLRAHRRRDGRRRAVAVARAARVLSAQLSIGQAPATALRSAAEDCPVLAGAAAVDRWGGSVTEHWRAESRRAGADGLRRIAAAWELSSATGAALAPALERVAVALADEHRLSSVLDAELAAPRATARLLAALPVVGLTLGFVLGGDPVDFLTDQPVGRVCLIAGTALACAGTLWVEHIAAGPGARDRPRAAG